MKKNRNINFSYDIISTKSKCAHFILILLLLVVVVEKIQQVIKETGNNGCVIYFYTDVMTKIENCICRLGLG